MKLYYSPGACLLAPHIAAREAGLDLELVKVDLRAKTLEDGSSYVAINPKGAVPALTLDDGALLTENAVVLQYLAEQAPGSGLMPPAGSMERWRLLELLNFIATELHKGFGPLWNPTTPPEVREQTVKLLGKKFGLLEAQLADRPYLTGETFSIADAYAYAVLNWTGYHRVDLTPWPGLQRYLARIAERPGAGRALREEGLTG